MIGVLVIVTRCLEHVGAVGADGEVELEQELVGRTTPPA